MIAGRLSTLIRSTKPRRLNSIFFSPALFHASHLPESRTLLCVAWGHVSHQLNWMPQDTCTVPNKQSSYFFTSHEIRLRCAELFYTHYYKKFFKHFTSSSNVRAKAMRQTTFIKKEIAPNLFSTCLTRLQRLRAVRNAAFFVRSQACPRVNPAKTRQKTSTTSTV